MAKQLNTVVLLHNGNLGIDESTALCDQLAFFVKIKTKFVKAKIQPDKTTNIFLCIPHMFLTPLILNCSRGFIAGYVHGKAVQKLFSGGE